jgi:hypothetical protein
VQLQNMQCHVGLLNRGRPDQPNDARLRQFAHHGEFPEVLVERDHVVACRTKAGERPATDTRVEAGKGAPPAMGLRRPLPAIDTLREPRVASVVATVVGRIRMGCHPLPGRA